MVPAGEGKMFSPGNLRATFDNPEYEKLISYWVGEKYTLRYTGGMVPDVFQVGKNPCPMHSNPVLGFLSCWGAKERFPMGSREVLSNILAVLWQA